MSLNIALIAAGITGVVFFLGYLVLVKLGRYREALETRLQIGRASCRERV